MQRFFYLETFSSVYKMKYRKKFNHRNSKFSMNQCILNCLMLIVLEVMGYGPKTCILQVSKKIITIFWSILGLLLNCNWSIVSDITLYIVIPTRRSIASATQILISHAFGDAISPYLIGVVADWIRPILNPYHPLSPNNWTNRIEVILYNSLFS